MSLGGPGGELGIYNELLGDTMKLQIVKNTPPKRRKQFKKTSVAKAMGLFGDS
jgi:hypothetical protein